MRILALLNSAAGDRAQHAQHNGSIDREVAVRAAFEQAGAAADVRAVPGDRIAAEAKAALATVNVIVAAGGDGTVSAIASVMAGSGKPMGVLPSGTLNHFAKDMRLPIDLPDAARVIAHGKPRAIDVAEVNGRVFINNSSIGFYPHVVQHRDRQMERLGRGKWMAMLVAWLSVFRRDPTVLVRLTSDDGQTQICKTPFVFVGNNRYEIDLLNLGARTALDRGELCVYFTRRTGRWGLITLAARALFNRLNQSRDFEMKLVKELWIETGKTKLSVSLDGEVTYLQPPLHYQIRPGQLQVMLDGGTEP
jgi:diacylglycerol kinase family enzyme